VGKTTAIQKNQKGDSKVRTEREGIPSLLKGVLLDGRLKEKGRRESDSLVEMVQQTRS